ncbi:DUF5686 family protein [Robertkochia solimangrovi]|uniref:DUF5686 family protein n=1 Tax=Robertkochia solimangrovi TaxID=2213046 RepID=UPI001180E4BF|nr:DUF5686 family protein [Robertkochia solimangrovi]TRZ46371.1 carboxypeptidase-like regulatory domain-containing protein [Robertkochia solimangrovi]
MNSIKLLFFLLFTNALFSQQLLTGTISANPDHKPLPFATIIADNGTATITDIEGNFKIEYTTDIHSLTISYIGYQTQTIPVSSDKKITIQLYPHTKELSQVEITASKDQADDIIRKAIAFKKQNDPKTALNSYSFKSYRRAVVTANPEDLKGEVDSIFTTREGELSFVSADSTAYSMKKQMERSHLYITETLSNTAFQKELGQQETIMANRMAGLEEPVYRLLSFKLQSFSFYQEAYELFGTKYKSPLSHNPFNTYNFRILDTVSQYGRDAYMIYYYPANEHKTARLQGVLYIDKESYALQKGIAQLKGTLDIDVTQEYFYIEDSNLWFPSLTDIVVGEGSEDLPVKLFGKVDIKKQPEINDTLEYHTNREKVSSFIKFYSRETAFDFSFNQKVNIEEKGLAVKVADSASIRPESYWNEFRSDSITLRDQETYVVLDSIATANKLNEKIGFWKKLFTGYLTTKYIDFDLKYLIKYNNYEAFRTGMGAITNDRFSKNARLSAYTAYGTRDKDLKYGFGGAYRYDKASDSWLGFNYVDDLVETGSSKFITEGRKFYVFEPRLFNITSFQRNRMISTHIAYNFNPKLKAKLQFDHTDTAPTYYYVYLRDGEVPFTHYQTSTATVAFHWDPFSEYIRTADEVLPYKTGFPQFTVQATQGFKDTFKSDFSFTKFQAMIVHEIELFDESKFTFNFRGGIAFGELPITELYHASPNQPKKDALLQRFSVAGRDSFETMYFDEFYSDRYMSLQSKYFFKPWNISKIINPELVLISRFAIGDVNDLQNHVGVPFTSLENGFMESGFEINNILSGFGLNLMYRYGAYHLPIFEDNLSFKFTFYLSLGI